MEQAAAVARLARCNEGCLLELVAMRYIERDDLDSAMEIARELPKNNQNETFTGNIEREVARIYIEERDDLSRAGEIADASYYGAVKTTIWKWIKEANPNGLEFTNREELGRRLDEFNRIFYKV